MTRARERQRGQVVLFTPREAAAQLGCSENHVYRLIASGALRAVDIGQPGAQRSKTRVRSDDLFDYIEKRTRLPNFRLRFGLHFQLRFQHAAGMVIDQSRKTRENRLRHAARRQGLELRKNPRRDPRALDFGSYMLVNPSTSGMVADFGWITPGRGDHLDAVELYLYPDHMHRTPSASKES